MGGVEEVTVELEFGRKAGDEVWCAIEGVADDSMAERLEMDPDLMGSTGFDADLDESEGAIDAG
jgi:hypothetical protein